MIYKDELDVEEVAINNDDNLQKEDEDEQGLNIKEENQEPLNEEGIFITEEEENSEFDKLLNPEGIYIMEEEEKNEVDITNIEINENDNVTNEK